MSVFLTADGLVALVTLAALEVVLGVDNLVFTMPLKRAIQPSGFRLDVLANPDRAGLVMGGDEHQATRDGHPPCCACGSHDQTPHN